MDGIGGGWWDGGACACIMRGFGWSLGIEALPELNYLIHFVARNECVVDVSVDVVIGN